MATATTTKLMTAEEFMAADLGEGIYELVRGVVCELELPMPEHGRVSGDVMFVLELFGRRSKFGYCLARSAVLTNRAPDTVRGPDACFYSHARWPRAEVGDTLPPVPPDVAVEVVSPHDQMVAITKKVSEHVGAGVSLVWVVFPERRQIVIYRATEDETISLHENDVIENLPELPGFRCAVSDLFV